MAAIPDSAQKTWDDQAQPAPVESSSPRSLAAVEALMRLTRVEVVDVDDLPPDFVATFKVGLSD